MTHDTIINEINNIFQAFLKSRKWSKRTLQHEWTRLPEEGLRLDDPNIIDNFNSFLTVTFNDFYTMSLQMTCTRPTLVVTQTTIEISTMIIPGDSLICA